MVHFLGAGDRALAERFSEVRPPIRSLFEQLELPDLKDPLAYLHGGYRSVRDLPITAELLACQLGVLACAVWWRTVAAPASVGRQRFTFCSEIVEGGTST